MPAKKTSNKKTSAKKTSAKKTSSKKSPAKKTSAKKDPAKKSSAAPAPGFATEITNLPFQRSFRGAPVLPLVLQCEKKDATVEQTAEWITANQKWLEDKLNTHGTILFRGFPLDSAEAFNTFVEGFKGPGWKDLSYSDSLSFAVRTPLTGRVCTTNDGKNGGLVFHHEQAQTPRWPAKVFFYSLQAATQGGGTGISPSDHLLTYLEEKYPKFVKEVEAKGVKYSFVVGPDPDPTIGVGRGWKSFFGRETKDECEKRMVEYGYTWEWLGDDGMLLRATSPRLDAVKTAPGSGKRVFFNQLVATVANVQEWLKNELVKNVAGDAKPAKKQKKASAEATEAPDVSGRLAQFLTFGDGTPIDFEVLKFAREKADELAVEVQWVTGDVALIDNYSVMHARRLWDDKHGPRKLLASLTAAEPKDLKPRADQLKDVAERNKAAKAGAKSKAAKAGAKPKASPKGKRKAQELSASDNLM